MATKTKTKLRRHLRHDSQGAVIKSRRLAGVKYRTIVNLETNEVFCTCPWGLSHASARATDISLCWHVRREIEYLRRRGLKVSGCCVHCGGTTALTPLADKAGNPLPGYICGHCCLKDEQPQGDPEPYACVHCKDTNWAWDPDGGHECGCRPEPAPLDLANPRDAALLAMIDRF